MLQHFLMESRNCERVLWIGLPTFCFFGFGCFAGGLTLSAIKLGKLGISPQKSAGFWCLMIPDGPQIRQSPTSWVACPKTQPSRATKIQVCFAWRAVVTVIVVLRSSRNVLERTLCYFGSYILYDTEAVPLGLSFGCPWRGKSPSFYPSNPLSELDSAYLNHSLG